ncbi:MAG: class I adenylate-forming enzyme family protein, partial [Solirubrobacteraceae bacterium]
MGNTEEQQLLSLPHYLDHWARCFPEREVAVDGDLRLTYAQLADSVDGCARAFLDAGVQPGDRVAMLTTPRLEFLIVLLALHRVGAVWVGLNPRHRLTELDHVIKDTTPRLLIGIKRFEERDFEEDLLELARRNEPRKAPLILVDQQPDPRFYMALRTREVGNDELAQAASVVKGVSPSCVVYTSGSTGKPKGAILCHYGQIRAYQRWHAYLGLERTCMISDLPVDHVGGLDRIFLTLIGGGSLVFKRRFEPSALLECIQRERINVWLGELTQWVKCAPLLDHYDLSSLEAIGYGGGPPARELLERYARVCTRIFAGYGMTETSDAVMWTDPGCSLEALCEHNVGRPLDGVLTRLVSADGEPIDRGEAGLLEVRSSTVFLGYLNRPDATAAAFTSDGWFRTGDLLREREDGTFDFLGRSNHTYKSGGYNIHPREIELVLEGHPAVSAAAVVSVPDKVFQSVGHAFVELLDGEAVDPEELRSHCAERLANYKLPKTITIFERLPTLRNEKVDRVLLSERARELALASDR